VNFDLELLLAGFESQLHMGHGCVFEHVGQPLLNRAVGSLLHLDRNVAVLYRQLCGDIQTGRASVIPEQLIAAVRIVAAGDALIAPAITKRLIEQFARSAPALTPDANLSELTPRELVTEATVKTHVTRILTKLSLRDRVQAVVLAYETGLVSPGSG
jgi:Bacterial regulatory proteins, luxR family